MLSQLDIELMSACLVIAFRLCWSASSAKGNWPIAINTIDKQSHAAGDSALISNART